MIIVDVKHIFRTTQITSGLLILPGV